MIKCFVRMVIISIGIIDIPVAGAQIRFQNPVVLTSENGLPPAEIRCIRKGEDGFVWIGTTDGLCRFDGSVFESFLSIPGDSNSLLSNGILDVLAERDFVWVGTSRGLSRMDTRTGNLKHYQFSIEGSVPVDSLRVNQGVSVLLKDAQGNLFVGTSANGVFMYDRSSDAFKSFKQHETFRDDPAIKEGAHTILSMSEDPLNDSLIYVGAYAGLWRLNKFTKKLSWFFYPDPNREEQIWKNNVRRMLVHRDGKIYYGGWRGGLSYFDRTTDSFGSIVIDEPLAYSTYVSILPGDDGTILMSTINGIVEYHTIRNKVVSVRKNDPLNNRFFGANFIDEQQRAWLFSFRGLYIFDPTVQQFNSFDFGDVTRGWSFAFYSYELSSAELVIIPRHEQAIYHYDRETDAFTRIPLSVSSPGEIPSFITRGISPAPDGTITISSDIGLFSYHPKKRMLERHSFRPSLKYKRYRDVLWDSTGKLWLAAERDGLLCWDPVTNAVRHFLDELTPPESNAAISHVQFLKEDDKGNIWFSRADGIGVYLRESGKIRNFVYPSSPSQSFNQVIGISCDDEGRVWFSDRDGQIGFAETNHPEKGVVKKIDIRSRFGIDYLYDIVHDREQHLWGHGSKGLVKFNTTEMTLERYTFDYGQMQDDFFSLAIFKNGDIFLGGRNNIVIADPDELKLNQELPVPYLTDLEVLQTPQKLSDTLQLTYRENSFAFGFSAQAFTLGKDTRFRYRLIPFDEGWVEARDRRFANYTNIPPGEYMFELQAANNEGIWNPTTTTVSIAITEAWWMTWWFQASSMLAVALAAYALYRWRIRLHRQKADQQLVFEKKLAQVEMSALRAQMNPHFLFNSLNSIERYIIRNESRKASEYLNNFARLIRIILANSRTNYVSLKEELEALQLYLDMECLRFSDKFVYSIEVDPDIDVDLVSIPPMLIQPFVENAIWHGLMPKDESSEEKKVDLRVTRNGDNLRFTIEDNGVGRPDSASLKARRERNGQQSMGLQITSDRMEIIKKLYGLDTSVEIVDLKNDNGSPRGTRVEFVIAIG